MAVLPLPVAWLEKPTAVLLEPLAAPSHEALVSKRVFATFPELQPAIAGDAEAAKAKAAAVNRTIRNERASSAARENRLRESVNDCARERAIRSMVSPLQLRPCGARPRGIGYRQVITNAANDHSQRIKARHHINV